MTYGETYVTELKGSQLKETLEGIAENLSTIFHPTVICHTPDIKTLNVIAIAVGIFFAE
jgi:hypothetical protein